MIHILKSFTAKVWAGVLLLVVLSGLLVGFTRLLLPLASEYREQLALDLSQAIGAPVRIQSMDARLAGLSPELQLRGVEVLDPRDGGAQLRFGELRLRLSLMESLRGGAPRVGLATIVGARLVLRRRESGEILLIGLNDGEPSEEAASTAFSPAPFLSEGRLRLLDSEILWDNRMLGLPAMRVRVEEAQLANAGNRHQLSIRGDLTGGGELDVRADFFGHPERPAEWRGDLYFKSSGLDLHPLLAPFLPGDWEPHGELSTELWSRWDQGRPLSATGRVRVQRPSLGESWEQHPVLDELSTRLAMRRDGEGGIHLRLSELRLQRGGREPVPASLALDWRPLVEGGRISAHARDLCLAELAHVFSALPHAAAWRERLQGLAPRGTLNDLQLRMRFAEAQPPRWQAAGRITDLGVEATADSPAVSGLDFEFRADARHGEARIASSALRLAVPGLFRDTLPASRLAGELSWRQADDGEWRIRSDELTLDTPHIESRSRIDIRVPAGKAPPFLDLQTDFRNGDASAIGQYLPVGIMSDRLEVWLDRAIVSGRITSGSFLMRGPADAFPYRGREGLFQVLFGVEDTILDYQDDWPRLEEISAELDFQNQELRIHLLDGRMLESRVQHALAYIADLDDARLVRLKGRVDGPFADTFRILRETPLAERKARYIQGMRALGPSRLDLDADIPIEDEEEYRVEGQVAWAGDGAALALDEHDLKLMDLRGALRFDDDGVYAEPIRARLWDEPLSMRVDTRPAVSGRAAVTRVDADLQLIAGEVAKRLPHVLWRHVSGGSPARLALTIDHGSLGRDRIPLAYRLESKLNGVRVDLPSPLNKDREAVRPFFIEGSLPLTPGALLSLGFGDIQGAMRLGEDKDSGLTLKAAAVDCGTQRTPSVNQDGFRLNGRIGLLELESWLDLLAELQPERRPESGELQNPSRTVNLEIGSLHYLGSELRDVSLRMERTPNAWEAAVESRRLRGHVRVPDEPRGRHPLSVSLDRLDLSLSDWEDGGERLEAAELPDPRQAPGLNLLIRDLRLNGESIGALELVASPIADGVFLDRLELQGELLNITGRGSWVGEPARQRTSLILDGRSPNLGDALRRLAFTSALAEADMHMQADLYWDASPMDLSLQNLTGELDFEVGKGRILEMDPGVGRLFGLLNLGALQRRLTLDFSDLFSEGYAFDKITGHFNLVDGHAHADKVWITGPSADLEITGRTGLVDRDYEQLVMVTPELSATLPVAGAIAGGPLVAAALLLAKQVVGDEVNKLSRFQYRITGPWLDPVIRRVETDDDGSLSNLFESSGEGASEVPDALEENLFLQ